MKLDIEDIVEFEDIKHGTMYGAVTGFVEHGGSMYCKLELLNLAMYGTIIIPVYSVKKIHSMKEREYYNG